METKAIVQRVHFKQIISQTRYIHITSEHTAHLFFAQDSGHSVPDHLKSSLVIQKYEI